MGIPRNADITGFTRRQKILDIIILFSGSDSLLFAICRAGHNYNSYSEIFLDKLISNAMVLVMGINIKHHGITVVVSVAVFVVVSVEYMIME